MPHNAHHTSPLPPQRPDERGPRELLQILYARCWTIVFWLSLFLCAGLCFAYLTTPLYRATTRLIIERDEPNIISLQEVTPMHSSADDYYQTQYKIIESRAIARQAMATFTPGELDRLMSGGLMDLFNGFKTLVSFSPDTATSETDYQTIENFIKRISVRPIANSRLVDVGFDSGDPDLSARAANAAAAAYMGYNRDIRLAAVKNAIKWLDGRITRERSRLEEWERKLKTHEENLKKLDKTSPEWNDRYAERQILARETENARRVYDLLFHRHMEISLAKDMESGNVRVVDIAESPPTPWFPPRKTVIFLSLVFGLLSGITAALFSERMDDKVATPEKAGRNLNLQLLGTMPRISHKNDAKSGCPELFVHNHPQSPQGEAYKGIRTNIEFSASGAPPQVILVTSPGPEEGKTLTSANIAVAMTQAGKKVALVDCDLRKPRLHDLFGLDNDQGVSSILDGSLRGGEGLIKKPDIQGLGGLDVITAGPAPSNPSELLGSKKMAMLVRSLRKTYQTVILDTPPANTVTDTQLLAGLADGTIMVFDATATRRRQAEEAIQAISASNGKILGTVLNRHAARANRYYRYGKGTYGQRAYRF